MMATGTGHRCQRRVYAAFLILSLILLAALSIWRFWCASYFPLVAELPQGISVSHAVLEGRTMYEYRAVLHGDEALLVDYLTSLGLREVGLDDHSGARYIKKYPKQWWSPPSVAGVVDYRLFVSVKWDGTRPRGRPWMTEAEVRGRNAYVLQFGHVADTPL